MPDICEGCALQDRCDGRCGDTDPTFYETERANDERDYYERENKFFEQREED